MGGLLVGWTLTWNENVSQMLIRRKGVAGMLKRNNGKGEPFLTTGGEAE
jgi:hypothetical protein